MQILLGADETVIKINSKETNIEYIQNFINDCFTDVITKSNYIFIPKSFKSHHYRTFLLKWLYTLYTKKTNNYIPELKNLLVNRQHKAIKILFKKRVIHKINYSINKNKTIDITIKPRNDQIIHKLESFLKVKTLSPIKISTKEKKELLGKLIYSKDIINVPHIHIFDKNIMEKFLVKDEIKEAKECFIDKAYLVLGLTPCDDKKRVIKQYKLLARKYHPDMLNSKDIKTISLCTKKFQNISEAYKILKKAI
ncbi:MAG: J domain-containing protein [Campylobacteraceae bacterium]|nr:J domain-containing protein [Campylobacteraceae bacterium]